VTAIEPALAGTFIGPVTVNLPGGTSVAASLAGPHRATVPVPASVTEGGLTVAACGSTYGPLPFRRASFSLGLGSFEATFDQANGARHTPSLVTARAGATAAVRERFVYVLGGSGASGPLDTVEQALINADGTLGPFTIHPGRRLSTARRGHTTVIIQNHLYTVGGLGDEPLSSIERATVATDGSLGPSMLVSDVALTTARHGHTSIVIGNSLYILGGSDGSALDSVERATIDPDGSLGQFAPVAGVRMVTARHGHATVVARNYLYVIGGLGPSGTLDDVERTAIGADGSLGPFERVAGLALETARSGHAALLLGDAVYLVGGTGRAGTTSSVERAPVDVDGLLASFASQPSAMLARRDGMATAIVGNYVYTMGGADGTVLASVERATLNSGGGALQPPAFSGVRFVASRSESATAVIGNYVYMIGGAITGSNVVERSSIGAEGALGQFAVVPGVTLVTPRRRHTAAVIQNYLYVIGGTGAGGTLRTIERAAINPDGSLGPFGVSANLASPRTAHASAVVGSYLYVIGGTDPGGGLRSVERATINEDGSLGPFAMVSDLMLTFARAGHRSILIRDHLYIVGGDTEFVERALVNSDGSLGPFATVSTPLLNPERFEAAAAVVGNHLYVVGGLASFGQGDSEHTIITATGSLLSFSTSTLGTIRRFGHSMVIFDNYLHIIGGEGPDFQPAEPSVYSVPLN
jgi:N-acetylneuraminic acid mutarotase